VRLSFLEHSNGKQKDLIEENYYNNKKMNIRNYKNLAKERFNSVWQTNNHQKFDHTTINLCTDYFTYLFRFTFNPLIFENSFNMLIEVLMEFSDPSIII
jgi:hypothetical protein